jgi:hypothetical protein
MFNLARVANRGRQLAGVLLPGPAAPVAIFGVALWR